jgi:sulfotransferase family protein
VPEFRAAAGVWFIVGWSMAERLRGPDFFIVGAPKCGTTAMADYLGQHPELGMAAAKERHYFGSDLYPRLARRKDRRSKPPRRQDWLDQRRDEYLRLFADVQDRKRVGEASVWYLYSSEAAGEIKEFSPKADIIAMLRNPLEMLPSLHSQFVHVGIEPVEDFEQAVALDEQRLKSGTPPGFPPRSYRSAVQYADQLRRYLDVFGREKVHVIIYDDFRDRTRDVYRGTCEFLGVDPSYEPELEVVNPNKRVRSRALRRLLWQTPETLRGALHSVTSQSTRVRVGTALKRWNTKFVARKAPPDHVTRSLRPIVAREVEELRDLLGIDVGYWLE